MVIAFLLYWWTVCEKTKGNALVDGSANMEKEAVVQVEFSSR